MIARDIMTDHPRTIGPDEAVGDAAKILESMDVRHLPVVDARGALVGMLTDRDIRNIRVPAVPAGETVDSSFLRSRLPVARVMSTDLVSVSPETNVGEIIDKLVERKIGAVPVVDAHGVLVGIVSYVDILLGLRRSLKAAA